MSTTEESLSDIMAGSSAFVSATPVPAKGESAEKTAEAATPAAKETDAKAEKPDAKPDRSRDESGRFSKDEDKPAEKPQEKPRADVAAIIDERRKRQEAERRLAEVLQAQEKPAAKPSVFENEDEAISARVAEGNRPLRETLYKQSVKIARLTYKEAYEEAEQAFLEASGRDSRLIAGLQASDDPGEYIYTMGIHVRELADVDGDLLKYREKVTSGMRGEIEARDARIKALEADLAAAKEAQTELDNVPRSLNSTSSGPSPRPGDEGPEDIKSIVRFGNKSR